MEEKSVTWITSVLPLDGWIVSEASRPRLWVRSLKASNVSAEMLNFSIFLVQKVMKALHEWFTWFAALVLASSYLLTLSTSREISSELSSTLTELEQRNHISVNCFRDFETQISSKFLQVDYEALSLNTALMEQLVFELARQQLAKITFGDLFLRDNKSQLKCVSVISGVIVCSAYLRLAYLENEDTIYANLLVFIDTKSTGSILQMSFARWLTMKRAEKFMTKRSARAHRPPIVHFADNRRRASGFIDRPCMTALDKNRSRIRCGFTWKLICVGRLQSSIVRGFALRKSEFAKKKLSNGLIELAYKLLMLMA